MNRNPEIKIKSKIKIKREAFDTRLNLNLNRDLPFRPYGPNAGLGYRGGRP